MPHTTPTCIPPHSPVAPGNATPQKQKFQNEPTKVPAVALILASLLLFAAPVRSLLTLSLADDRYAHTILIPLLAAGIAYLSFNAIHRFSSESKILIVFLLTSALIMRFATPAANLTLQITALVIVWLSALILFYGRAALLSFPALLLLLTIPPPPSVMDALSTTLQSASAGISHLLFRLLAVPVFRQDNTFALPGLTIEVAEQCSGIRSTLALIISSILVSYFALRSPLNRLSLVIATAFIAVFKNAVRIVFLATMAVYVDESILHGLLHHTYGGTVFTLFALTLLAPILYLLRRSEQRGNRLLATLTLLLILPACRKDAETAKKQYVQSGQAYAKKSDFKSAIVEYHNALQYDRKNVDVLQNLAEAYLANRQPREAYAALMQAAAVDPNRSDVRLNLGRLYLSANDYKKAEEQAAAIVQKDPDNVAAQQILGASLSAQNQHDKAIQVFERVAELSPKDASSFINLGVSQSAAGKAADAERNLRKAAELDPKHPQVYLALADFHRRAGRLALAEQELQKGISANPDAPNLYLAQANILAAQSKSEQLETLLTTLRTRVRKPEVAAAIGDFYASRNQRERAIVEYRRGAELAPSDIELKTRLVELHLASGQIAEAGKWNDEVLRARPKDVRAGVARGRILLSAGKRDEAIVELRKQVSQARDSAPAHHYLALAYIATMQTAQAKTEFQEAIRLDGAFLPPRLSLAELHVNLGELAPAREVAESAARSFPGNPAVRSVLASVLLRQRNFAGAREQLALAASANPNDPAVHMMLGVSHGAERKFEDAQREFETALRLNPRYTPALAELASMWTAAGQSAKAMARLQEHTNIYGDDADAHLLLGSIARQARDHAKAEAALARAAELAPNSSQVHIQLGGVYQDQGRLDPAIQQYEQALKLEPRSSGILALLGTARLRKGDVEAARKNFQQGLSIDPNSSVIANNLAVANALERGNLDEAMALAQKAREISPDLVNAADTLGWIQYQKGLYPSAVRHLEEAVKKVPESGTYQYHLGMALVAAGQKDRGRGHLETAVRLKLDGPDAAQARTTLAKLR